MNENKNEQPDVKSPVALSKFIPFPGAQTELFNAPVNPNQFLIRGRGF